MLIIALALVVGPIVVGKTVLTDSLIKAIPMDLFQPINQNNNDTRNRTETGSASVSSAAKTSSSKRLF